MDATIDSPSTLDDDDTSSISSTPRLTHQIKHTQSILALAISHKSIYAGSQAGEILKWSLGSGDLTNRNDLHRGSVLCLFLSQDEERLFSCAGDAIVHMVCPDSLQPLFSIYSTYDVGDVFSVVHCSSLDTLYLGAQNTSIQWIDLTDLDSRPSPDPELHPSRRIHRFFDSKGPGGVTRSRSSSLKQRSEGSRIQIDNQHIRQYAHNGYVYCMILSSSCFGKEASDDEVLISGGGDGTIKVWELDEDDSGAIIESFTLDNGDASVLSLAIDGCLLYSGLLEGGVHIWDLETQQLIRTLEFDSEDVLSLSLGASANCLFAGTANGRVKQYDRSQYRCIAEWQAHDGVVLASTAIAEGSEWLYITGGNDGKIKTWDMSQTRPELKRRSSTISQSEILNSLAEFVSYRTVSSYHQQYVEECRRGAIFLRNLFRKFGASTEILGTEESLNPIVFAKFKGKSAVRSPRKRILFYGHYDVVDAIDPKGTWIVDPFKLESINGYIYGRGATDNKGPILAALYAAAELVAEQTLESDILFLIEGEEECGSRGLEAAVQRNKHLIGEIDFILVANSYWIDDDVPCLTYGLRGVIHATMTVESDSPDLHSGVDGSTLIDEPLQDLIAVLAKLTSTHGRVQIPGFYADIPPLTKAEHNRFAAIAQVLQTHNLSDEIDADTLTTSLIKRWREPSLTVHRIKTSGPDDGAVIPCHARAALSIRLVPNQDLANVSLDLTRFVTGQFERLQSKNHIKINIDRTAEPWLGDPENQIFQTLEKAIIDVWRLNTNSTDDTSKGSAQVKTLQPSTKPSAQRKGPPTSSTLTRGANTSPALGASLSSSSKQQTKLSLRTSASSSKQPPLSPPQITFSTAKPRAPLYIREGGSIGGIRFLEKEFRAPAAHFPCGQASDKAHLDNERLRVRNLMNACEIFKRVFREL